MYLEPASRRAAASDFSTDTQLTNYFVAYYGGAFKLRYKPGWNLINLRTSDLTAVGSPNWATIKHIRIRLNSNR